MSNQIELSKIAGQGFLHKDNLTIALDITMGGRNNKKSSARMKKIWFDLWKDPLSHHAVFRYYRNMHKLSLYSGLKKWFKILEPFCPNTKDWIFNDKDTEIFCWRREYDPVTKKIVSYKQEIRFMGIYAGGIDKAKGAELIVGYWNGYTFDEVQEQSDAGKIITDEDNLTAHDNLVQLAKTFIRRPEEFRDKKYQQFTVSWISNNKIKGHFIETKYFKNYIKGKKYEIIQQLEEYGYWQFYDKDFFTEWGKGLYISITSLYIAKYFDENWLDKKEIIAANKLKVSDNNKWLEDVIGWFTIPSNSYFGNILEKIKPEKEDWELKKGWVPYSMGLDAAYNDFTELKIGFTNAASRDEPMWTKKATKLYRVIKPIKDKKDNIALKDDDKAIYRNQMAVLVARQIFYLSESFPKMKLFPGITLWIDAQWDHLIPLIQESLDKIAIQLKEEKKQFIWKPWLQILSNATFKKTYEKEKKYNVQYDIYDSIECFLPERLKTSLSKLLKKNGKIVELPEKQGQDEIDAELYGDQPYYDNFINGFKRDIIFNIDELELIINGQNK